MTRTRRSDLTHPMLHVFSRGADRQDIFSADVDRHRFELLLADLPDRFNVAIHAISLMHNHVHLIVDRADGDVSAAMQHLFGRYARLYNDRADRTGPLFTGRFGAIEIESDEQLLQCSRYVQLNPVEFVPLDAIVAYRWSTLGVYAGRRAKPEWLTTMLLPGLFHRSPQEYVSFVLSPQGGDRHGRPLQPWLTLTLDDVDIAVRLEGGGRPIPVRRGRTDTARQLAIAAAVELRVADTTTIAEHHRLSTPVSVRTSARRARVRSVDDPDFAAIYRRVVDRLRRQAAQAGLPGRLRRAS